ncbi:MAG: caspase family protein [Magnetospirillum sp.]|nr:MAG: caspase family protein [Magnetospirillum sp.]
MIRRLPWVLCILLALAGCAGRAPEIDDMRTAFDPSGRNPDLAGVPATGALSGLRLGLVDGDYKRAAIATITALSKIFDPTGVLQSEYNPHRIGEDLERALNARFKAVSAADTLTQAFARGDDLVMVVDMAVTFGNMTGMVTSVTVTGTLHGRDGAVIGKAVGHGQNTIPWPATPVFRASWVAALADMLRRVDADATQIVAQAGEHQGGVAAKGSEQPAPARAHTVVASPAPAPRFAAQSLSLRYPKGSDRPDDVAVIIGNADYGKQGKDIPDVKPAYADAEGMRRYATQALGVREGNVIVLRDATSAQITRVFGSDKDHRGQLFDWTKPGRSRVFVYYSGHGAPGRDGGTPFLVPADADAARIELNGYPLRQLYDNLGKLPAESVTVVLEACFSGLSPAGSVLGKASPVFFEVKAPPVPANLTVIAAGAANQVASWEPDDSHGLFTKNFLVGMAGKADFDKDGKVGLDELDRYLKDTLTYLARRHYGRDQTAQIVRGGGR